jgi:transcriptional regulator with XRE-family HTH domain
MCAQFGGAWTGRQLLITQRLRERRSQLGLTQKQVVTRLGRVGVQTTNRALSSLEHGTGLDVAKLPELASALDCTVTYLVGLTEDPHRWEPDQRVIDLTNGHRQDHRAALAPASNGAARNSWILGAGVPDRDLHVDATGTSNAR